MKLSPNQVRRVSAHMRIHRYYLRYIGTVRKTKRYDLWFRRGTGSVYVREISAPCLKHYFVPSGVY